MSTLTTAIISTLVILVVIFFALWFFERMVARKSGKYAGLAMPALLFAMSTFSVLSSLPAMLEGTAEQTYTYPQVALFTIISLLLFNIPTIWTYLVYRRTRKKLGKEVWPFHDKSAAYDDKKSK